MISWEQAISRWLRALHLDSIRSKILAFAVLATLIPSLSTTWVSYVANRRSLTAKISQVLRDVSTQAAGELEFWLKERLYDLRVFGSSYEVSETLARLPQPHGGPALGRLSHYLNSVGERFTDYEELLVVDPQGRVVATSTREVGRGGAVQLPRDWQTEIRANNAALGDPYRDEASGKPVTVFAVPIRLADGRIVGALAAKLNLRGVEAILKRLAPDPSGQTFVMTADGGLIATSGSGAVNLLQTKLGPAQARALRGRPGATVEYKNPAGTKVVGTLRLAPRLHWAVVAEIPAAAAYRQVTRLRNVTALIVSALLAGVGMIAYVLGLLIVRPLDRLTEGAAKVAAGDLAVDLPVLSGGEVGYLTTVFNDMVAHLREKNTELERLSVTDSLTALYNRRHLMETLASEVRRSRRLKHRFAVLMADVDNFKGYNDAHGHPAGDEVLARVAAILRELTREVDCVARYGGEEFLVMLPEADVAGAITVGERIRKRLAAEAFGGGKITMSLGVAAFPDHGDSPESLIASADAALYQAKRAGRDRMVAAGRRPKAKETGPPS